MPFLPTRSRGRRLPLPISNSLGGRGFRKIHGVDEVQAFLLAMQIAHTELLSAREHDGRQVSWLNQRSLGLPIPDFNP